MSRLERRRRASSSERIPEPDRHSCVPGSLRRARGRSMNAEGRRIRSGGLRRARRPGVPPPRALATQRESCRGCRCRRQYPSYGQSARFAHSPARQACTRNGLFSTPSVQHMRASSFGAEGYRHDHRPSVRSHRGKRSRMVTGARTPEPNQEGTTRRTILKGGAAGSLRLDHVDEPVTVVRVLGKSVIRIRPVARCRSQPAAAARSSCSPPVGAARATVSTSILSTPGRTALRNTCSKRARASATDCSIAVSSCGSGVGVRVGAARVGVPTIVGVGGLLVGTRATASLTGLEAAARGGSSTKPHPHNTVSAARAQHRQRMSLNHDLRRHLPGVIATHRGELVGLCECE
jgi:hypothetical protein